MRRKVHEHSVCRLVGEIRPIRGVSELCSAQLKVCGQTETREVLNVYTKDFPRSIMPRYGAVG